eukprot:jgi/Psemu1/314920/fgenesh1_kg.1772_\
MRCEDAALNGSNADADSDADSDSDSDSDTNARWTVLRPFLPPWNRRAPIPTRTPGCWGWGWGSALHPPPPWRGVAWHGSLRRYLSPCHCHCHCRGRGRGRGICAVVAVALLAAVTRSRSRSDQQESLLLVCYI